MRHLLLRLRYLLHRQRFEDDLAEEMEFHQSLKRRELEERGHAPDVAVAASRRALGNVALAREQARDVWIPAWVSEALRDVRFAARTFWRSPGFTAVAVITLALGIGANAAIFSLLNAVLVRPLPVHSPHELVFFGNATATGSTGFVPNGSTQLFSYQFFRDFRRESSAFADVAAIGSVLYGTYGRVAGSASLEKVRVELVSGSYFQTLGVPAIAGRTLSDSDDETPGGHPIAVASYAWSQRRFGNGESVLGSTVSIGPRSYVVVGIAPPGFAGVTVGQSPDLWVSLAMQRDISPGWNGLEDPMFQTLHLIARLKPGAIATQAQASTNLLFHNLLRAYVGPDASENRLKNLQRAYIQLTPAVTGRSDLRSQFASPLLVLMALVGVVLLIACANVANLLLARATVREREIALRMAVGAGRLRLVRQLLTESLLLGGAGAALGLLIAVGASRLLVALVSTSTESVALAVGPDLTVLVFTAAVGILTSLLFGATPALHAMRLDLTPSLKDGRSAGSSPVRTRLSRSLLIGEIALSLVLIAGAMLFLRSFTKVMELETGFEKQQVLVTAVEPGAAGYKADDRLESMMTRVEERVTSIPGVRGASFVYFAFNRGSWSTDAIDVPGRQNSESNVGVNLNLVGPDYLDILKMPVLAGRGLSARDTMAAPPIAVINETMARMYLGEPFPIGRTFTVQDDRADASDLDNIEVVGVVKDAKYTALEEGQTPAAFFPHAQHRRNFLFTLVARYDGELTAIVPALRQAVAEIDPNLPIGDVTTLERLVDDSVLNRRAIAELSTLFGLLAIALACVGIYGVTAYGIARRTNELGIRMALGASRSQVLWLVLGETIRTGVLGIAIGLVMAFGFGRIVSSLLFGLTPQDPLTISLAVTTMIAVSIGAGYLPARRATRTDPLVALRHD